MSETDISVENLEKEVLIHMAQDRQLLLELVHDLAENLDPIVIDEDMIDVRLNHDLYEKLFTILEDFGYLEAEIFADE